MVPHQKGSTEVYDLRRSVPDSLTAFRVAAAFVLPIACVFQQNPLWFVWETEFGTGLFALVTIAAVTDILDGWSARWLRCQENGFGKLFDPAADALLCVGGAVAVLIEAGMTTHAMVFYWAPMALMMAYSAVVTRMRWGGHIGKSNPEARLAIFCLMFAGCMFFARMAFNQAAMEAAAVGMMFAGLLFEWRSLQAYRKQSRARRTNNLATAAILPVRPT